MKIYIKDFMPQELKPNSMILNKTTYQNVYTENGLFRIQNDNIFKLIPQDITPEEFNYNNIEFIIDKSSYIFRKNIYTIPYKHLLYNIEQFEYKLLNNSEVSLIIHYHKNKVIDVYFMTKKELSIHLKNDIMEYISLFNDIKQS